MDLRLTFNEDEYNYDKIRPCYPNELYNDIFSYSKITSESKILEIGIGTGQATLPFLDKKCNVTAVELGDKLAKYSKNKFSEYKNFNIINSDFLKCNLSTKTFDLIYSATAFHWISKDHGYAKIKTLLKQGGTLSLFWNHPFVSRKDDESNIASMKVYSKYRPNDNHAVEFNRTDCQKYTDELKDYGFTDIKSKIYHRIRTLSTDEYLSLLNTYSDHLALPENIKSAFEKDMKNAIDAIGGKINIYDTIDLYLAKHKIC